MGYWLVRINSIYSPITNHYHCNSLLVVSVPALGTSTSKTSPLDGRLRSELTGMIWSYGILEFLEFLAPKKKCSLEKNFGDNSSSKKKSKKKLKFTSLKK